MTDETGKQPPLVVAMERVTKAARAVRTCREELEASIKELDAAEKAFKKEARAATK